MSQDHKPITLATETCMLYLGRYPFIMKIILIVLLVNVFISLVFSSPEGTNLKGRDVDNCTICLQNLSKSGYIARCGHIYHQVCIQDWLQKQSTCPLCRNIISDNPVIEELIAEKEKVMKQPVSYGCPSVPQISPEMELCIKLYDLLAAVFIAIFEQDKISRNVLCHYLLEDQHLCTMATSDEEVVQIFLEQIENVDQIVINGQSLLHYAACKGRPEIMRIILSKARCLDKQTIDGDTALMLALLYDKFDVAAMLANQMVNVDQENEYGFTALDHANSKGRADVVEILSTKTDRINKKDSCGTTPLRVALIYNHFDVVWLLVMNNTIFNSLSDAIQFFGEKMLTAPSPLGLYVMMVIIFVILWLGLQC